MRILILDNIAISLNQNEKTDIIEFSKHLAAVGHRITAITAGDTKVFTSDQSANVEIHNINCLRFKNLLSDLLTGFSYIISGYYYLRALMKKDCFDVACIRYMTVTGLLGVWLKKKYNLPYVLINGNDNMDCNYQGSAHSPQKLNKRFWQKACAEAWAITATSDSLREIILKNNPNTPCEVVPNGIAIGEYFHEPKHLNILATCESYQPAGLLDVIRAFSSLNAEGWLLFVSGKCPCQFELEELAESLGIASHICFVGWPDRKSTKYKMILARTSIYVSMSRCDDNDISVTEALASGCNVVLSDIPSHRYFQRFGAMLVPLNDQLTLERTLQTAMRKTPVFDYASSDLDWSSIVKQLDSLLITAAASVNSNSK